MGVDKFRRKVSFRGPISIKASSAATQFAGTVTIGSGAVSAVISTTAVHSNSMIFAGLPVLTGAVAAVTTSLGQLAVTSITDGAAFVIGWANGGNVAAQAVVVPWLIQQPA